MDHHRGLNVEVFFSVSNLKIVEKMKYKLQIFEEIHLYFAHARIAQIFNTYGPRMCLDDGRVVSNFVAQVCFSSLF